VHIEGDAENNQRCNVHTSTNATFSSTTTIATALYQHKALCACATIATITSALTAVSNDVKNIKMKFSRKI